MVHLAGDILHLLAGSAWIGALAAFILMLSRRSPVFDQFDTAHRALAGFATAGTVIVGLVIVTGIVNSYALIGPQNMSGLFQSAYGQRSEEHTSELQSLMPNHIACFCWKKKK